MGLPLDEHKRRWLAFVDNGPSKANAAKALNIAASTFKSWLGEFQYMLKRAGLESPTPAFWESLADDEEIVVDAPPADSAEAIKMARLEQQVKALRSELNATKQNLVADDDLRKSVFGLADPLEPVQFDPPSIKEEVGETVIVFLSDFHWGEVISLHAMDGINSYDLEIGRKRLQRAFHAIVDLTTRHWPGLPPERIIVVLGGDMISGDIHEELRKTNALSAIPAVRDLVGHLETGIELLLDTHDCPIDIITVPGNHSRSTMKPESKNAVATSYDILVSDFLESIYKNDKRVTFYSPASGDALFSIYGYKILATHGDKIGSRGGHGFIGPAAVAARGMKKLAAEYSAIGTHLDLILMGHLHVALELEEGLVNGSLAGYSEYSRMHRMRPKPATQLFLTIHPRRGVTQVRRIQVGVSEEGSIYAPRKSAYDERPVYTIAPVGAA